MTPDESDGQGPAGETDGTEARLDRGWVAWLVLVVVVLLSSLAAVLFSHDHPFRDRTGQGAEAESADKDVTCTDYLLGLGSVRSGAGVTMQEVSTLAGGLNDGSISVAMGLSEVRRFAAEFRNLDIELTSLGPPPAVATDAALLAHEALRVMEDAMSAFASGLEQDSPVLIDDASRMISESIELFTSVSVTCPP
jgi:hypothetical protein